MTLARLVLPALLATAGWLAGGLAHAAPDTPAVVDTVPVAPWTFPADPERGVAAEYLRFLFDAAGIKARYGTLPYVRVINGLRDGSNTAAMLIPDAERDTFAIRLCTVGTIRAGLVYKKSRFRQLDLAALDGMTVGVQRGTHALDKLSSVPRLRQHVVQSVEQGLKMLQVDRLDATFLSSPGSDIVLRDNGMAPSEHGWLEVGASPVVVYVSRKAALGSDQPALSRLRAACQGPGPAVMQALLLKYR